MGLFKRYVNQTRKPEGFLGMMMLKGMNFGHARLAYWGMGHLPALSPKAVADLGCQRFALAGRCAKRTI